MTDYASFLVNPLNVEIVGHRLFAEERARSAHDDGLLWMLDRTALEGTYAVLDVDVELIGTSPTDPPPGVPYDVDGLPAGASARLAGTTSLDFDGVGFDIEIGRVYLSRADGQIWSCYLRFADSGAPLDLWGAAQAHDDGGDGAMPLPVRAMFDLHDRATKGEVRIDEGELPREEVHALAAAILTEIAGWSPRLRVRSANEAGEGSNGGAS